VFVLGEDDMGDWLERHRGYVAMTLGYAIILAGVLFLRSPRSDETPIEIHSPTAAPTATVAPIRVHISGAVRNPGVFELPGGSRVQEAVEAAGGVTEEADLDRINLAAWVNDGQRVHVPTKGETDPPAANLDAGTSTGLAGTGKININTATAEQLDTLPGIGPAYAERIIRYRQEQGPFESIEQIMEVRGIGQVCFEDVKDMICVR
jgi:competence protein ComEA